MVTRAVTKDQKPDHTLSGAKYRHKQKYQMIIKVQQKNRRTKNGVLMNFKNGNPAKIFHPEPSKPLLLKNEEIRSKNPDKNCVRLKFVKKASTSNLIKSLLCTKCYSWSSSRHVKIPSTFNKSNYEKICIGTRRPKVILKTRKNTSLVQQTHSFFRFSEI